MKSKVFSLCMIFFVLLICTTVSATDTSNNTNESTYVDTVACQSETLVQEVTSYVTQEISTTSDESTNEELNSNETNSYESEYEFTIDETDTVESTLDSEILSESDDLEISVTASESSQLLSTINNVVISNKDASSSVDVELSTQTDIVSSTKEVKSDDQTYSIYGNTSCVYNETSGTYVGDELDAIGVANATVTLYNTTNGVKIAQVKSNSTGGYSFTGLKSGYYTVTFEYGTYLMGEEYSHITNASDIINYVFIPDLAIITYSGSSSDGQYNKYLALRQLSDRFYFLESYEMNNTYDNSAQWMLSYTNFILVDMYSVGLGFGIDEDLIASSPASENNMIAYTFGVYSDSILMSLGWGFVGGSPNSLENTYIGSYWQAEAIDDETVVATNMNNLYKYILYVLGESDENPTDSLDGIPVLAGPQWGIYYPGFEIEVSTPSSAQIKEWIESDPGYNDDGVGSLNWMTNCYNPWVLENQKPTSVFRTFENWYTENVDIDGSFIVIISYYETTIEVEALIKELEANGQATFCLYQYSTIEPSMTDLLLTACTDPDGFTRGIVAGISLYSWSTSYSEMGTNATVEAYTQMDITILNALSGISKDSYLSEYGPQTEWTYQVTVAEYEGIISPIPVSYNENDGTTVIIEDGIAKIAQLAMGYANLKTKDNSEKKIAIVLYNYPPGKANIGASYLDVYTSTHDLLVQLAEAGYDIGMSVDEIPTTEELTTMIIDMGNKGSWASGLLKQYVEENYDTLMANNQLISLDQWQEMYDSLPSNLQEELTECWGTGLGNGSMVYNDTYLVIPGIYFGNVFITLQPARGWDEVTDYHSSDLAPPPQYVAFYKYLYNYYQGIDGNSVDAIISMGTHGTLEWLPGRTLGLQSSDWPFQLTEVPIIYPYIVSNPGEGMTAKERSFAQVITHMTPVTTASTLYGTYLEISDAITSYHSNVKSGDTSNVEYYKSLILNLTTTNGSFTTPTFQRMLDNITIYNTALLINDVELINSSKENIIYLSESLNKSMNEYFNYSLPGDLEFDEFLEYMTEYCESDDAFDSWLSYIENTIESLSGDTITYGMHTLGYVWNETEMVQGITTIASSRTEILQHIQELYYGIYTDYYDNIKSSDFEEYETQIESTLNNIIKRLVANPTTDMALQIASEMNQNNESDFYNDLVQIVSYIEGVQNNMEWESILNALNGGYVAPGLAGEPSLSDVLPTGRSMYSSDTTKMPTKAAWATAVEAVDQLLISYMEDLGEDTYPELVGQVIWGTEVLRTEGVSLAMYLYLLGVTPVWANDGTVTGVEVIPLEDLTLTIDGVVYQRPRIDVFATIVSSNTGWITLLYDAVNLVNDLDEDVTENYVKKHYAELNSTYRLFGLDGAKLEGTGVSDLLNNIASWENSTDGVSYEAASVYEARMSNAWTIDENGDISVINNQNTVLVYLLTNVDLIIQDIDSTWQYLDSDDYTDWYGGLLNAANVHGSTPNTMLIDIRNQNEVTTSTLSQQISTEVITTLTNPQWIAEMVSSVGGWNQLATNYENLIKTIYTTQGYAEDENGKAISSTGGNNTGAISNELFTQTVYFMTSSDYLIDDANYKGYAMQSIWGWEMTLLMDGYWKTDDTELVTTLIQRYVDSVNNWGVACCHHTCGNVNLHEWILTTGSSLGVKGLETYSQLYNSATETGTVLGTGTSGTGSGSGDGSGSGTGTGGTGTGTGTGGTIIGDDSFAGYGDVGVSDGIGSVANGVVNGGSATSTNTGSLTGSGSGSSGSGSGSGSGTGNGNGTGSGNGSGDGDGSGNGSGEGSGEGSENGNGSTSSDGTGSGSSTDLGESSASDGSSAGGSSAGGSSSEGAEGSAAASGLTSATAAVYEVSSGEGGVAASSYSEIGLGYILLIIGLAILFFIGFTRRRTRG